MAGSQSQVNKMIKGEIYDSLRAALVAPVGKTKQSWTDQFIQKMLAEAKANPSGPLGQLISRQIMQDDILTSLDSQTEKLLMRDKDFLEYRLYKRCYQEQRNVLLDTYSKNILVNTGRRTGKTNLASMWLVKKCVTPNSPCFYIHLKFDNAIRQCFDLCIEAAKAIELNIEQSSKSEGFINFSNGSSIKFCGNSNKSEADKMRGFKARGIVIEEAAFQINMEYLINDVLSPMMADYTDSQMLLISTPPRVPHTYYEKCYRNKGWTVYEWYANKNPFIPDFDAFIEELCTKKGLTKDDAFIQREAYGKFVYDTEALVYKGYKTYDELPPDFHLSKIIIMQDFGFVDYNATMSVLIDDMHKKAYLYKEDKYNKAGMDEIVNHILNAYNEGCERLKGYGLEVKPNNNIIIVTDTNEPSLCYDLNKKYKLPTQKAYKYDKVPAIEELAMEMRTGRLLIHSSLKETINECESTVWDRDEEGNLIPEIAETYHPDIMDAVLYGSRIWLERWGTKYPEFEPEVISPKNAGTDVKNAVINSTLPPWMQKQSSVQSLGGMQL